MNFNDTTPLVEWVDTTHEWPNEKVRQNAVRTEDRLIELLTEINTHTSKVLKQYNKGNDDAWSAIVDQTGSFGFRGQMAKWAAEAEHLAEMFVTLVSTTTFKRNED